jgi:hypothetical protein
MRLEFAGLVPPELFGCQPPGTLDETAFDLAEVHRRVQ